MKRRRTENQLIYQSPGLLEKLAIQYDKHYDEFKTCPLRIYLPAEVYAEYLDVLGQRAASKVFYRGSRVLPMESTRQEREKK